MIDSKNKENDKLRDKITKLKELKIDNKALPKAAIPLREIDDKVRTFAPPDVRKRDDKARNFAPPDEARKLEEEKALKKVSRLKQFNYENINMDKIIISLEKQPIKQPKKQPKISLENFNKYEDINFDIVNSLYNEIDRNFSLDDNIVNLGNNEKVYFKDIINILKYIKNSKINNFNREKIFNEKFKDTEKN